MSICISDLSICIFTLSLSWPEGIHVLSHSVESQYAAAFGRATAAFSINKPIMFNQLTFPVFRTHQGIQQTHELNCQRCLTMELQRYCISHAKLATDSSAMPMWPLTHQSCQHGHVNGACHQSLVCLDAFFCRLYLCITLQTACMLMVRSILVGPNTSVMTNWLWNLLNVGVALVGYHAAALSIDWKWWGRKRMQVRPQNRQCGHAAMCLLIRSRHAG